MNKIITQKCQEEKTDGSGKMPTSRKTRRKEKNQRNAFRDQEDDENLKEEENEDNAGRRLLRNDLQPRRGD